MARNERQKMMVSFAEQLRERIAGKVDPAAPRTYGFEYEFLAAEPPTENCVRKMHGCLAELGFRHHDQCLENSRGLRVTFEPGGQIEYHSMPLLPDADAEFDATLREIDNANDAIRWECGVNYQAVPYMPGRGAAPLCLTSDRYLNLHKRLEASGRRGLEMMKGTASIHLHARILTLREMPALFALMFDLAENPTFRMGPDRRDIWNNTDPSRCGMPYIRPGADTPAEDLVRDIVRVGLDAVALGVEVPYWQTTDPDFASFLYHLTTLFTDVRLNMSAPTLELRTLDAMPGNRFRERWRKFVNAVEAMEVVGHEQRR